MSAAVLLSLIEAVTMTPMRAAFLMGTEHKVNRLEHFLEGVFARLSVAYGKLLAFSLRFSKTIVFGSVLLFIGSLTLVKGLRQEFVPSQDQNRVFLTGQLPSGSSLETTYEKAKEVEQVIRQDPDVETFFISVGAGGPSVEVNQFSAPVTLKPREERNLTHNQVMDRIREELKAVKGVRVSMRDMSARGLTSGRQFAVSFNLRGPSLEVLRQKGEEIMNKLDAEGLTQDMDMDFKAGIPEILIRPDRQSMANHGVAIEAVAQALNSAVAGVRTSRFTAAGRRYDVRVKVRDQKIRSPEDIERILVRNNYGNLVPLSKLVVFENRTTFQSINRVNRQRAIGVFGNVKAGQSQGAVLSRAKDIANEILPDGYSFAFEGAAAGLSQSFRSLGIALLLGIVVAYMVLAVQFNSFVHPISVLIALPFSMTGALLVLWGTGSSLNLFSFIGLIVLMGIAKKNSILLVEFTNHVRQEGETNLACALLTACPVRLRPILMTSVATVAAAVPLVVGNSIGQETRTPMGLTIIGGTVVSTVFTLFVVPCLYLMLSRFESKKGAVKFEVGRRPQVHSVKHEAFGR
jgi:multidrug efflux pump subunit AcrB